VLQGEGEVKSLANPRYRGHLTLYARAKQSQGAKGEGK